MKAYNTGLGLLSDEKRRFQIDRLILFSDAVFAIAITLLIIEIRPPDMEGLSISDHNFWVAFLPSIPKFIGFAMSFAMIGLYWAKHHQLFGYVTDYTPKLIFLNLLLLFSIVLMPYTTAVYSDFSDQEYVQLMLPYLFYVCNIVLCGLSNYLLLNYITHEKHHVSHYVFEKNRIRNARLRILILPMAFTFSFLICWIFESQMGRMLLFLIPIFYLFVKDQRLPEKKVQHPV